MSVVELPAERYAEVDAELDELDASQYDDFDAFWAGKSRDVRPAKIRGVVVRPPVDVPLALLQDADNVMGSADIDAVHEVVRRIFGRDVLSRWIDAGMGLREFQTIVAWAGAAMRGAPIDFEEAAKLAGEALDKAAEEVAEGKAGTRRERRAKRGGRKRSGGTGG